MPDEKTTTQEVETTEIPVGPAGSFADAMFGNVSEPPAESEESEETTPDTEAETTEEADTEAETDQPDLSALMADNKLTGQYKTPKDVIEAMPHMRKALAERDEELLDAKTRVKALEKILYKEEERKKEPSHPALEDDQLQELLATNPRAALRAVLEEEGYVRKQDIEPVIKSVDSIQNDQAFNAVVAGIRAIPELADVAQYYIAKQEKPPAGLNETWDAMMHELQARPWLTAAPPSEAFRLLYDLSQRSATSPKPESVPSERKKRATTTGTDRAAKRFVLPPGFEKLSTDEQLKYYKSQGLVT